MNYAQIDRLLNAGYSKEEIDRLQLQEAAPDNAQPSPGEVPDSPQPSPGEVPDNPQPSPGQESSGMEEITKAVQSAIADFQKGINAEIAELKKAYHEYNLIWANNMAETSKGAEDILADLLITPSYKKEKE